MLCPQFSPQLMPSLRLSQSGDEIVEPLYELFTFERLSDGIQWIFDNRDLLWKSRLFGASQ